MSGRGTRDWFAERDVAEGEHPVDAEVRERLARGSAPEGDRHVAHLKRVVTAALGARLEPWLELEALLNERAAAREAAYYNLGVDVGRASRIAEDVAGEGAIDPRDALRSVVAIAQDLAELGRRGLATLERTPRVLVVDDETPVARSLSRLLSARFEVHTSDGAEAALASLERLAFDVLVSDYDMPGRDGVWLLREAAQRSPGTSRVLTSAGDVPDVNGLLQAGMAQAFIAKGRAVAELLPLLLRLTREP